ncbi:MAG: hypothetical protein IPN84_13200 [Sphingomonadales bacterium]|nr:hypothetical protein [Sphingomonadales bacterium]
MAGIAFLDKAGKLYPWPHMVNLQGQSLTDILVDASPGTIEPNLGFLPIRLNETEAWNKITVAYTNLLGASLCPRWGDEHADALSDEFLESLRAKAATLRWPLDCLEIPATLPSLAG